MCLQCEVNAICIGNKPIFGDYYLIKSQKENEYWDKDYYGLVLCNDPLFVWSIKDMEHSNFYEYLYTDPYNGYLLYKSFIDYGYVKNIDGNFTSWFKDIVCKFIKENEK